MIIIYMICFDGKGLLNVENLRSSLFHVLIKPIRDMTQ